MEKAYQNFPLFRGLSEEETELVIRSSGSKIRTFEKGELIFDQYERPVEMFVLVEGSVNVGKDYADGREAHMTTFRKPGDIFGEILLFLDKPHYDFFARAEEHTRVLCIPRSFLTEEQGRDNRLQHKLITNVMSVFASKAYFLQRRVQVLSLNSLRKRLARAILQETEDHSSHSVSINRETLAGIVNAARPSVSRELSAMEKDGLIEIHGSAICIVSRDKLEEISE